MKNFLSVKVINFVLIKKMFKCFYSIIFIIALLILLGKNTSTKYVEGHLKTKNDWAFLARFCFFSGRGRYEYIIEFEKLYGELQLLLYYDDKTQWPAVYKTSRSCKDKLNVLSVHDNQIVTLSAKQPHNLLSGCILRSNKISTTEIPTITTIKPSSSTDFQFLYNKFLNFNLTYPTNLDKEHNDTNLNDKKNITNNEEVRIKFNTYEFIQI